VITSSDGLAGALVADGKYILTSPNCTFLPDPPLGGDRHLFLRTNLRYGEDDPVQWPQPFLASYAYLACIPRGTTSSRDPANIMWWLPERTSFVEDNGILGGIGGIHYSYLYQLKSLSLELIIRAQSEKFKNTMVAIQMSIRLKHLLHRLEFISTSFYKARLGVRELQRMYLELTGFLDYEEFYRRETGSSNRAANIMGTFTTSLAVCEQLFHAGVPVWLVRPYSALHSIRILRLMPITYAQTEVPLEASFWPKYPPIYRGPGGSPAKYLAIAKQGLDYLSYPNPFGDICATPLATPLPAAEPSKREIRAQRYTPCKPYCPFFVGYD
jgi:hypothetical protein